jgi:chromosome partitioning protein
MHVISFASRKGGSGKTTLSGHIAVQAQRSGFGKVAIMDFDPQGSLKDWWHSRQDKELLFFDTSLKSFGRDVKRAKADGAALLIIDTAPALEPEVQAVIERSDLILVPTRPSPHDLRSVGATVELVEKRGKPMIFVINGATPRAKITEEAIAALSAHGPLAPVIVHQRVDFASSMIDGRTVMEISLKTRSSEEISELWEFVKTRLETANGGALLRFVNRLWYDKSSGNATNCRIQGVS